MRPQNCQSYAEQTNKSYMDVPIRLGPRRPLWHLSCAGLRLACALQITGAAIDKSGLPDDRSELAARVPLEDSLRSARLRNRPMRNHMSAVGRQRKREEQKHFKQQITSIYCTSVAWSMCDKRHIHSWFVHTENSNMTHGMFASNIANFN